MNIVSMIMQFLAPAIIGKLASSLGINQTIAQKAIGALLPTILAGIVGKAASPGGAGALFDMLGKQDPGLLGKLGGMIGGPQQATLATQGAEALGGLLGNSTLGSLLGAAGKFSGMNDTATKGLAGMLAPVILGTLGQQQKSAGLDAAGFASMLMGQKDNIAAAVPQDFAKLLGGSGLLDSIGPNLAKATAGASVTNMAETAGKAASNLGQAASRTVGDAGRSVAQEAKSSFSWWPWAVAVIAAGAAWYYFMAGPRVAPRVELPVAPKIMAGTTDIGGQFSTMLGGLQGSLGSIKDVASANAALPKLKTTATEIDRLSGLTGALPADAKKSLAGYMTTALPLLMPVINNLLANSSFAPILKPVLDTMVGKLTAMSKVQ